MPIILDRDTNFIPISRLILLFLQTWEECTQYFRVDEERGLSPGQVKDFLSSYFLKFLYFSFSHFHLSRVQVEEYKKKYGPNGEFTNNI